MKGSEIAVFNFYHNSKLKSFMLSFACSKSNFEHECFISFALHIQARSAFPLLWTLDLFFLHYWWNSDEHLLLHFSITPALSERVALSSICFIYAFMKHFFVTWHKLKTMTPAASSGCWRGPEGNCNEICNLMLSNTDTFGPYFWDGSHLATFKMKLCCWPTSRWSNVMSFSVVTAVLVGVLVCRRHSDLQLFQQISTWDVQNRTKFIG